MGKIPQAFRTSQLPTSQFLKNKQSPSTPPQKPYFLTPKNPKKTQQKINNRPEKVKSLTPLINFTSPNLSDAKTQFKSLISTQKNTPFDTRFCNSVLQSYSCVSSFQDSILLLNYMVKIHPEFLPDRHTYHVLLLQSCKSTDDDSLSSVHDALNLMANNGFSPNKVTTDIAVRALCSSGREEHAVELVKELSSKDSPPDTYTYNFLIRCLCRNRSVSSMNNFIKDMREGFGIKPDLVTYTIMIDNVCNGKNLREATRLLEVLSEEGIKPDAYVYNTIMKGYCMLNLGSEALGVYNKMQEEGVKPDLVTFNTLVYGLSKSGKVKEAKKFLRIMAETGNFPDAVTYTSLMNGVCRQGDALGALALLEEMEARGCTPNDCTYSTLLHGLCKAKLLDKAIELYEIMKKGDMKLDAGSYGTFLRTLCRNGRVADAYEVFEYAVESKSLSDVSAYTTLEGTLKWLMKAREQGLAV
ncbi:hypothetical protein LIER_14668 [Lithospermum erythrorhizon]|uniref:Pentatricopeptide repeat-containing protein n=1 Tax=Lithospermum erythrorhizon TaxID=34254 RepID=A0AAV3Q583_LITER